MVLPPCLLHALLPRGKQGTSHEPFRQLFSGLKIPEVFTEAICTQFREGEHKRDWALWVLVGLGLGLQSAALSCEPKRRQGQSVLGCPGGSSRFLPLSFTRVPVNTGWRETCVLGLWTQHWCWWVRLPWKRAGQGLFSGLFSHAVVWLLACKGVQWESTSTHISDPRDLLSMHPGRRTSRGMHVREHLCAISSLSHMTLKAPPALFPALLDSPVCSQVCWVFANEKDGLDMMSSWPAANLSQPWGGNHKPRRGLTKKTFSLQGVKKISSKWFRFVGERGCSPFLSCRVSPSFLCQPGARCLLYLLGWICC